VSHIDAITKEKAKEFVGDDEQTTWCFGLIHLSLELPHTPHVTGILLFILYVRLFYTLIPNVDKRSC
jgi:hypothetical protein